MAKPRILQQLDGDLSTDIVLNTDPDQAMEAATKQYVDKSGTPIINITSTDQINYTGTSDSITEYKEGMIISFIPDVSSKATSSYLTININNLGPLKVGQYTLKQIYQSNGMGTWYDIGNREANFIYANEVFTGHIQYKDTNQWFFLPFHPSLKLNDISNGAFGKNLSVTADAAYLNSNILRNIKVSTSAPSSSDGNIGDIWIQYFN